MLKFGGRVAIVTGAGGGLGRCYALLLASRGASVVVNDLGVSRSGEGKSGKAADIVVQEIRDRGGKAVANYDSVENGEALVKTALDNFGRIDIIINNAGILRDRTIAKTSDEDWDLVHKVHLKGAFQVTRAAWPHMRQQKYGRIVNTSSVAGLYGNFGQANYSSAKLGLVGLTNTCAAEGERSGIHCNVIVPMAASRLTEDIFPPEMMEMLQPDLIAPIVAWLCHEDCKDNGAIIEAAGGWAGKYRWQRSQGCVLTHSLAEGLSLESVRDNWSKVTEMEGGNFPTSNQEATMELVEKLKPPQQPQAIQSSNSTPGIDPSAVLGYTSDPFEYSYSHKELILYSLSVGVSTQDEDGLQLLYEGHSDFAPLSSFGTIPGFGGLTQLITGSVPGVNIDLSKVLHGEQYTEVINPIPTSGTLISTFKVSAVLDKGSGAVLVVDILSKDKATGQDVLKNQMSVFVVGSGGFGGPRTSDACIAAADKMPSRSPDATKEYKTSLDQAALYRLNADPNPLHIDPSFAAMAGFERPILHGLCSLGIAVRQVTAAFAQNNPNKVKAIKARFAKPVLPGQTIKVDMWKEGSKILFECRVKETGTLCLTGGWIELRNDGKEVQSSNPKLGLKSESIFDELTARLKAKPELASKIGAVFRWIITKEQKPVAQWIVNLKSNPGEIFREESNIPNPLKADCTLTLSDDDMESLVKGSLKPQSAFMQGKLKVQGNVMLTQKLQALIGDEAKL